MENTEAVEVGFNFDTTGSMRPCIAEVRRSVESNFTTLLKEVPKLRIALGANGDYCDRHTTYVTEWHDLSADMHSLCNFVRTVRNTGGGDMPECYELVLHQARSLDWSIRANKTFVLIADALPHPPHSDQNIAYNGTGLDWRKEADELAKLGVTVHAVQCLRSGGHTDQFYQELAERGGGFHFTLDQFSEITDLIMAICYHQGGTDQLKDWETKIESAGRMTRSMDANLARLSGRAVADRFHKTPKSLDAVSPGRFQMLRVDTDASIKTFVEGNELEFRKGRGFYEFTKAETIQENKEVVLRDQVAGDMYTGDTAREMIGLPRGTRGRVKPAEVTGFDVFIQSTSYNRKLVGGTRFLYEVDMDR